MRYKITVSYLGANYCGWQNQKNGISVQEVLEKAFEKLFQKKTTLHASGRTDAGVHAEGQVAHFDMQTSIPPDKIPYAINTFLPDDIRVLSCEVADENFHARFSAKRKTYEYRMYLSPHINPLKNITAEQVIGELDLDAMRKAAKFIEGTHDFKCFEASGSKIIDTCRTVYAVEISDDQNDIVISVTGNGFLYNMVRIIAGTLVDVGRGKIAPEDILDIISKKDRTLAGKTLPAKGLCLKAVDYDSFRDKQG